MRTYQHDPDWEWINDNLDFHRDGVARSGATIERLRARKSPMRYDIAVQNVELAVAYGWAAEDPVEKLRALLDQGAVWVSEAVTLDGLETPVVQRFLVVASMAGAWDTAARVAALVPDGLTGPERDPLSLGFLTGLARLAEGNHRAAAASADDMRRAIDENPAVPPRIVELYGTLTDLLAAAARQDAAALEAAMNERAADVARTYGGSIEDRRHAHGLLDTWGAAIVAAASRDGLPIPDNTYLGTDLIKADR